MLHPTPYQSSMVQHLTGGVYGVGCARWDACFIRLLDGMLQAGALGSSDYQLRIPTKIRHLEIIDPSPALPTGSEGAPRVSDSGGSADDADSACMPCASGHLQGCGEGFAPVRLRGTVPITGVALGAPAMSVPTVTHCPALQCCQGGGVGYSSRLCLIDQQNHPTTHKGTRAAVWIVRSQTPHASSALRLHHMKVLTLPEVAMGCAQSWRAWTPRSSLLHHFRSPHFA